MNKKTALSALTLIFSSFCCLSYAATSCTPGYIDNIRFDKKSSGERTIVIKIDTIQNENYTDHSDLIQPLLYAYATKEKIILYTESCTTGDHGFAKFSLGSKYLKALP